MRVRQLLPLAFLAFGAACESTLEVDPTRYVAEDDAIIDGPSARAALAGAYDALQSQYYYGDGIFTLPDLSSDNVEWAGTFTVYRQLDRHTVVTTNGEIEGLWGIMYDGINRANVVIQRVPTLTNVSEAEKDRIVGEAYFLRALHYHNLVKLWGGVPIRTEPVDVIDDAAEVTRASVAEVYTQILGDLAQAEARLEDHGDTRAANQGAVRALRARVLLYQASPGPTGSSTANWAGVLAAAEATLTGGYTLAADYADLFHRSGANSPEDILRVRFVLEDPFWTGYYYLIEDFGGRYEVAPTPDMAAAYEPGDERGEWSIEVTEDELIYGTKFPTATGGEHPHVIRLAEVILIQAEALARLNRLPEAVNAYNRLRVRAGVAPHVLGVDVVTQADVINAIVQERRVELAFEGDRWPDLVRTGTAVATIGIPSSRAHQVLYPIPQSEIDVTRNPDGSARLAQNPGY